LFLLAVVDPAETFRPYADGDAVFAGKQATADLATP
jgi:hypothetical protein